MDRLNLATKPLKGFLILGVVASSFLTSGYVLLGDKPYTLIVPKDTGTVTFVLDATPPHIVDKTDFADGRYSTSTDEDFFAIVVQAAMDKWNEVPGIAIKLGIAAERNATTDDSDNRHSISVNSDLSFSIEAYAQPIKDEKSVHITDCDIQIRDEIDSAQTFAITLTHELGHCLGLGHNHTDYKSIMSYSPLHRPFAIGLDDMAGLIRLYPAPTQNKSSKFAPCGMIKTSNVDHNFEDDTLLRTNFLMMLVPFLIPAFFALSAFVSGRVRFSHPQK